MGLSIRRLQPGDEQIALEVIRKLVPEDEREGREPSLAHLQRFLSLDTNYLMAAIDGDRPVGFLSAYRMPSLSWDDEMVYLFEIEVAPAFRRQGIGKGLVNHLKAVCRKDGAADLWVGTEKDNLAARRLYESTGGVCEYPDNCEYVYDLTQG